MERNWGAIYKRSSSSHKPKIQFGSGWDNNCFYDTERVTQYDSGNLLLQNNQSLELANRAQQQDLDSLGISRQYIGDNSFHLGHTHTHTHTLSIYLEVSKPTHYRDTSEQMFIVALFTIAKKRSQTWCPATGEWGKQMWHLCKTERFSTTELNDTIKFAGNRCKSRSLG